MTFATGIYIILYIVSNHGFNYIWWYLLITDFTWEYKTYSCFNGNWVVLGYNRSQTLMLFMVTGLACVRVSLVDSSEAAIKWSAMVSSIAVCRERLLYFTFTQCQQAQISVETSSYGAFKHRGKHFLCNKMYRQMINCFAKRPIHTSRYGKVENIKIWFSVKVWLENEYLTSVMSPKWNSILISNKRPSSYKSGQEYVNYDDCVMLIKTIHRMWHLHM